MNLLLNGLGLMRWWSCLGLMLCSLMAGAQGVQPLTIKSLHYQSVFVKYQGFKEQPVLSWQEANATVTAIGGWRAYAKEANSPEVIDHNMMSPSQLMPEDTSGRQP